MSKKWAKSLSTTGNARLQADSELPHQVSLPPVRLKVRLARLLAIRAVSDAGGIPGA